MSADFFPPRPASNPTIYAYEDGNPQFAGMLKRPSARAIAGIRHN